jgi:hypothetical protein
MAHGKKTKEKGKRENKKLHRTGRPAWIEILLCSMILAYDILVDFEIISRVKYLPVLQIKQIMETISGLKLFISISITFDL